ncbi:helix-turn-helix transcriptional regulator [Sphingobium sp. WTD-1]|uniref:helix-turn-helix domain-containing protein n=1 Tax=Sphingobium sp. WTD-1 TaxID=2979467 RepID=UPI0024DE9928|nr:helix-turn-helix transcriptional regulator [Sphingobium sp. WTD-1]WIA57132.1 helix-turn-helix transcriptional regulator [Sphingobium sp. WTD-1]
MKKVTPQGSLIKQLRSQLETGSLQKEMSHAIRISERRVRLIENENAPVTVPELERIAVYLGVPRDTIAYAINTPKLVLPASDTTQSLLDDLFRHACRLFCPTIISRWTARWSKRGPA